MTRRAIPYAQLRRHNITGVEDFSSFKCSKPEFEEYLKVNALYDQGAQTGRTYAFTHEGRIVGYVALAMSHMPSTEQRHLGIDTYGTVPALLMRYMATHKQYERRGIGSNMVLWVVKYGKTVAKNIGCRAVLADSDPDVVGFYEKLGFVHLVSKTDMKNAMYFDLKDHMQERGP